MRPAGRGVPLRHDPRPQPLRRTAQRPRHVHPIAVQPAHNGYRAASFYQTDDAGHRPRAHYDGLPVDFVAEAITTLGTQVTDGFRSFDVMNPYDDGISLDVFVDWLTRPATRSTRIDDYEDWLARFETALTGLPERQRQHSVLPLLHAFREPERPLPGAAAPTEVFQAAVRAAKVGDDKDIPHLSASLINKYVSDLNAARACSERRRRPIVALTLGTSRRSRCWWPGPGSSNSCDLPLLGRQFSTCRN